VANVILDTGPLVALFKRNDRHHTPALAWFKRNKQRLITTLPVVTEAWHLVAPTAQVQLVEFVTKAVSVIDLGEDAMQRMHELVVQYRDRPMDFADASLVVLAERTGTNTVATIDSRDFSALRFGAGKHFRLVFE
jgi:uncharacterized protein